MTAATAEGRMKVFEGRTMDAEAPFVAADFWEIGKSISGEITKVFPSSIEGKSSMCYVIELESPIVMDGEEWDRVSIGNLSGFRLAMTAAGIDRLYTKDLIELECESIKKAKKEGYSPRPNFRVRVSRA